MGDLDSSNITKVGRPPPQGLRDCQPMLVTQASDLSQLLGGLGQEDGKFKLSLSYRENCLPGHRVRETDPKSVVQRYPNRDLE